MKNYIVINDQKIELTEDQVAQIVAAQGSSNIRLSEIPEGSICRVVGGMLSALQDVDAECKYCLFASMNTPCADETPAAWCPDCEHEQCPCRGCIENSKYQWCGTDEALRRLTSTNK